MTTRPRLIIAALTVAATLAGCDSTSDPLAGKTPEEILAATRAAAQAASSVDITTSAAQGPLKITTSQQLTSDGGWAKLHFLRLDYEVIRIGNTIYAKGNPVFYRRILRKHVSIPPGTWLKGSANTGKLARLTDLTQLQPNISRLLNNTNQLTKGPTSTINGTPTIALQDTGKLYKGTIYITNNNPPYPQQITKTGRETNHTTLTNWNQPTTLTAPTNTIEINKLDRG